MKKERHHLTIYDPRLQERTLKLSDGEVWSNVRANAVFFESDTYSVYTSSQFLKTLLSCLVQECPVAKIGVRSNDTRAAAKLEWAEERSVSDNSVSAILDVDLLDRLIDVLEDADYGVWNFCGIPEDSGEIDRLNMMPDVLNDLDSMRFVIELDLDGILMGCVSLSHCHDQLIRKLEQLSVEI